MNDLNLLEQPNNQNEVSEDEALEKLIGPGGKFYDPDRETAFKKLAKGKWIADQYIESQNMQLDELRSDYSKLREDATAGTKLQELIDRLSNMQQLNSEQPDANEIVEPAFSADSLKDLVSSQFKELKTQEQEAANFKTVQAKLKERYGDNYPQALKQQIEALGLTDQYANDLAKKNPNLFIKAFELDRAQDPDLFQTPFPSSVRNDKFAPTSTPKRTWSWYQKMKKEQPELYRDPKTQVQIHKDRIALGAAFKDGDYDKI